MYRAVYMGDYRVRHAGDFLGIGGAFKKIGKAVGGLAGIAGGVIPGPIGAAARVASKVLKGGGAPYAAGVAVGTAALGAGGGLPVLKLGSGIQINPKNILPGGAPFVSGVCPSGRFNQDGSCRKRPTMNVANPRALRRAIRRQTGFVKLARRALRGTGDVIGRRGTARKAIRRR
jgi:hypothetical protein